MTSQAWFDGGGECGGLIRSFDWASSSLGESSAWPAALKALVRVMMHARQPMLLWWGPELIQVYNDAFRPSLGPDKHPQAGYYRSILDGVYRTGEPCVIREAPLELLRGDSIEQRYIDVSYLAYRGADLTIRGVMAVINDVTPSVAARKEIERAEQTRAGLLAREQSLRIAAEAGERARDEFLAILGHELRNPLAPIAMATHVMRERSDHHPREREIIERQVKHLTRLVDDLLDVSRVASGKIELRRQEVELAEVLGKALELAGPLLEQRRHELVLDAPEQAVRMDADPVRFAQIINNLLQNAAKYTPPGGVIELRARAHESAVEISVADSGPGIPSDLLPRIFMLFVQGAQSIDRAQGGLGLGLSLVKSLVELHGGTVRAANRPAGGSEFVVTLPLISARTTNPTAHERQARCFGQPRALRKILIVDDNEDAAELLCKVLSDLGHEVKVVHTAESALEALQTFRADVALLDIGLPGMDGYQLARQLRGQSATSGLRLIAVTGYGQAQDRARARAAGFDRHLTKPLALAELIDYLDPAEG